MRIIDVHTHPRIYPDKSREDSLAESNRMLLEEMEVAGVRICGILGRVSPFQREDSVQYGNDYTRDVVRACPERFFGMAFVNPLHSPKFVAEELDRCLSLPEFRAIKLELDVCCRDKRLDLVMEKSLEYQVPVLHHSWYVNTWSMSEAGKIHQSGRSEPHDIADLARRFPEARIIMAHLEGSGIRGILDVAECENVWIDTSGSQPFTGTLEFALKTVGSERILFGSDLPGRYLPTQLGRIYGTKMSEQEREQILFKNAEALLGV